ncbi:YjfB family protein [Methylobacter svalbardensis]|uniref:YjfB family protein n=1 Tax=Methylobacter svalbardensis TaxID=3080016 RepID=UPI0030EBF459
MINSVGGSGVPVLIATAMKEAAVAQDVEIAVLKKSQEIDKTNGESALKLIVSAPSATSAGSIDFHV